MTNLQKRFKDKNILILGGLGFIGSNLAIRLVDLGAKVTLVDSMLPQYGGNSQNIQPILGRCKINYSDIRDTYSMNYLVKDVDVVFSMAGQTSHIDSMRDPHTDLDINCKSQLTLLEACRKENPSAQIIYASTRQIYGKPKYLPVDEAHPIDPVDVNGINKLAAENYFTLYSKVHGMRCISLRLTNTYGPRQHLSGDSQGFTGIFIRKVLSGEKIQIFGDGKQLRDFNYIDDVVNAFLHCVDEEGLSGGVFNLGAEEKFSLLDFVKELQKHVSFEFDIVPFPEDHKKIDIGDYYADFSKFHSQSGWEPKVLLSEGIKETIDYFRQYSKHYW